MLLVEDSVLLQARCHCTSGVGVCGCGVGSISISIRFSFYQTQIGSQTYHQMPTFQLLGCSLHQGRTSTD